LVKSELLRAFKIYDFAITHKKKRWYHDKAIESTFEKQKSLSESLSESLAENRRPEPLGVEKLCKYFNLTPDELMPIIPDHEPPEK
jgi:hypothetical protein